MEYAGVLSLCTSIIDDMRPWLTIEEIKSIDSALDYATPLAGAMHAIERGGRRGGHLSEETRRRIYAENWDTDPINRAYAGLIQEILAKSDNHAFA